MNDITQATAETETQVTSTELPVTGVNAETVAANLINIARPLAKMQEFNFAFRKDDLGEKRPSIRLNLPVPTADGIAAALSDEKQMQFILDVVAAEIQKAARTQVADETKPVNSQEELDLNKLTLDFIANMPKAERTGGGISKETWEAFGKDYMAIMPGILGKEEEKVQNAVTLYIKKFQPVKTNKAVLKQLKGYLALWASSTQALEEFGDCFEFLDNKIDSLLTADETALLANL